MRQYNSNAIIELYKRGYHKKHIAIIMGCKECTVEWNLKNAIISEGSLKYLTDAQKHTLFVFDKIFIKKPISTKWDSNCYFHITILKFLSMPKNDIKEIYKFAPQKNVAQACHEKAPKLSSFDYNSLGVTSEEWRDFVRSCYIFIGDIEKCI